MSPQNIFPDPNKPATPTEQTYHVDIVFCLDSTMSMEGIIDAAKAKCREMVEEILARFKSKQKTVAAVRARIVEFRDLVEDQGGQMIEHDFVDVYDAGNASPKVDALVQELEKVKAIGGGDDPESSLDALIRGTQAPWFQPAPGAAVKQRKLVALFTDNPPRPLHESSKTDADQGLADVDIVINRLSAAMAGNELRVLLVAPKCEAFDKIANFKYTKHIELDPGEAAQGKFKTSDFNPILQWVVDSSIN